MVNGYLQRREYPGTIVSIPLKRLFIYVMMICLAEIIPNNAVSKCGRFLVGDGSESPRRVSDCFIKGLMLTGRHGGQHKSLVSGQAVLPQSKAYFGYIPLPTMLAQWPVQLVTLSKPL